jgi:hypothetical protein
MLNGGRSPGEKRALIAAGNPDNQLLLHYRPLKIMDKHYLHKE